MKTYSSNSTMQTRGFAAVIAAVLVLAGCASTPQSPDGAAQVRSDLTALQNDPQLASRAPMEIRKAEEATKLAETPLPANEAALGAHRVQLAKDQVEIARAKAATKLAEDQREQLDRDRTDARLLARTGEADKAKADAASARRSEASSQRAQAEMQRRLNELEAKETERGMLITLGDVLFDTNSAHLRGASDHNLKRLSEFMRSYPEARLLIEGHTDNVGSAVYNQQLSQRRADSVRKYLVNQGIENHRMTISGVGLGRPIASNDTASGRQQNRRVEIVIENMAQASLSGEAR